MSASRYLAELSRYIVLNPVRVGLCAAVADWPWGSYAAVMGRTAAPGWQAVDETPELFHCQRGPACRAYARSVVAWSDAPDPLASVQRQWLLGSDSFVERMVDKAFQQELSAKVPRRQRPVRSLERIANDHVGRDAAIRTAYATGGYTLAEIGEYFGLHASMVSRIARGCMGGNAK